MRVFFKNKMTVHRLADASDKESYSENGEIRGYVAPISAEDTMITEGNPAQSFKLITDFASDIKKTDKIYYDEEYYIVKGIQKFKFGALKRKEAILEQFNS